MKKTLVFSIVLLIACAMGCSSDKDSKIQPITYQDFIDKIWDFDQHPDKFVFKGETAAIIEFYSRHCGPCGLLMNHLEKMADEYEGKLTVYKVDAEQEKELAVLFKVEGYPALFLIPKDGHKMMRRDGLPSEEGLRTLIEEQLLDQTKRQ